jgi:mono/diheme cytochrome c family protein
VTEIPEHLLKRSRERRAALSGDESAPADTAGSPATPAAATPATTPAAATPAPAKAAPPAKPAAPVVKPDPPYVAAAKARPKIPWWAMSTLALMPLILFMYIRGLTPEEAHAEGPTAAGAEIYASACASCHQPDGSGGAGRPINEGDLQLTFPKIEWQLNLVYTGSQPHAGVVYGDPNREGGAHIGLEFNGSAMPQQGSTAGGALTDAEILAVVCHERYDLPGAPDPTSQEWAEEYDRWCSEESPIYAGLEDGSLTFESEELGVGTEPIDFSAVSADDESPADEAFPAE